MAFQKGISGNPAGRPRGIKDKRVKAMEESREMLWEKIMELAMRGDLQALRIAADRCLPKIRSEYRPVRLPKTDDLKVLSEAIVTQVANGELPADIGRNVLEMLALNIDIEQLDDLMQKVRLIEKGEYGRSPETPASAYPRPRPRRKKQRVRIPK